MRYRVTIRVPSETAYVYELEAASKQEARRRFNDLDTDELEPVSSSTCDAIDDFPTIESIDEITPPVFVLSPYGWSEAG